MDYYQHQYNNTTTNNGYYYPLPAYETSSSYATGGIIYNQYQHQYPLSDYCSGGCGGDGTATADDVVVVVGDTNVDAAAAVAAESLKRRKRQRPSSSPMMMMMKQKHECEADCQDDSEGVRKRVKVEMICQLEQAETGSCVKRASSDECDDVYAEHLFRAYQSGELTKTRYKRLIANERERKRMHGLNVAFESLRQVLPSLGSNKQFSKFETLQMAKSYIAALRGILCNADNIPGSNGSNGEESSSSSSSSSSSLYDYCTIKHESTFSSSTTNNSHAD